MSDTPSANENTPRGSRGSIWPWLVGGLLGLTVIKYMVVMALIANDPSIAVEEDYYRRAIAWDEERAALSASDALGWSTEISVGPAAGPLGRSEARIELRDALAEPIRDAEVSVRVFHQARAARVIAESVRAGPDGVHRVPIPSTRRGLWRVEVEARRGEDRFLEERTVIWGQ